MAKILGVGIATLDIINTVEHYPNEDEELRAISQRYARGGNVTNTLSVLSQLSHECFWAGVLCEDSDANYILDDLHKNKISCQYCKQLGMGKIPTSYITVNQKNGSRTIVHYRNIPEYTFLDFKKIPLAEFDWIHFEARVVEENLKMIQWIKQDYPDKIVSIEIEKPRKNIEQLLQAADIYLYSRHFANATGFEDAKSFLMSCAEKQKNKDLVCAWGEQGAYCLTSGKQFIHQAALEIDKAIESLGAGDTFNAGIIHARLNNLSWAESLSHACQLAARKCLQQGFENLALKIKPVLSIVREN